VYRRNVGTVRHCGASITVLLLQSDDLSSAATAAPSIRSGATGHFRTPGTLDQNRQSGHRYAARTQLGKGIAVFLNVPDSPEAAAFLERERAAAGYVMNLERAWAWRPDIAEAFVALRKQLTDRSTLTAREIAILVCATARSLGDSYCALAWGSRLATLANPAFAAAILEGAGADLLTERERTLSAWTQQIVRDPNGATREQVDALRTAGLADLEIFEATAFVALRLAFSTVNDALGAQPDRQLAEAAPSEVRSAVSYGRPSSS